MAIPQTVSHLGSLTGAQSSWGPASALQDLANTSFQGTFGSAKNGRPTIVGATDGAPWVVPLEGIIKVRMLLVRIRGGSLKVKITSAAGTDQAMYISGPEGIFLWFDANSGEEITAIKFVGSGDVEYCVAGDVS